MLLMYIALSYFITPVLRLASKPNGIILEIYANLSGVGSTMDFI